MANYKIVYTMTDGSQIDQEIRNRTDDLIQLTNDIISNGYVTHVSPEGNNAVVINNRNVLYMEVTEI